MEPKRKVHLEKRNKPIRIAQLHWAFPPTIGGVETHLTVLLPELIKNGHKISLLTGSYRNSAEQSTYSGIKVTRTPYMNLEYLIDHQPDLYQQEIKEALLSFIEKSKPDLVHTHNMHYFSSVHPSLLSEICKSKGIPLVLTSHNAWNDIQFLQLSRDIQWDHIIAVSHYIKREMLGVGCPEEKVSVIHHGINVENFTPGINPQAVYDRFPQVKNKRIIFHPARLGLAKGSDVVIKAFRLVKEKFRDAVLILAGSSNIVDWNQSQRNDVAYILSLIKAFNLKKNVLIDTFRIEEMPALYSACQIALYPSTAMEPFGLTLLESIAMGKPMIVSNMGGMPEIIQNNISGYVVPVHDHLALAERISLLLANDKLRASIGATGRTLVEDHFSKELMTRNHEKVYFNLLKGK